MRFPPMIASKKAGDHSRMANLVSLPEPHKTITSICECSYKCVTSSKVALDACAVRRGEVLRISKHLE